MSFSAHGTTWRFVLKKKNEEEEETDESVATDDDEDESITTNNDEEMKINDGEMIHESDKGETSSREETDDDEGEDDEDEESLSTDDEGEIDDTSNNETESSEETSDNEMVPIASSDKENRMIVEDDLFDEELDECILEMLDEVILEICFESHRAAKLGFIEGKLSVLYWRNYRPRKEIESVVPIENKGKGRKRDAGKGKKGAPTFIMCPNIGCIHGRKKGTTKFAAHIKTCIYGLGRKTKEINYYEDSSSITQTRPKRKPRTTAFTVESLLEMSLDEKREFFAKHCGVKLRYSKKGALCGESVLHCTKHKDKDRKIWSEKHLGAHGSSTYEHCY